MKRLDRAYILRRKSLNHEQVNATKSSAEDEQKEAHSYQSTRKSKRRYHNEINIAYFFPNRAHHADAFIEIVRKNSIIRKPLLQRPVQ